MRARRGEGDRTREAIIDAADQLLLSSASQEAVSIRAVADAVGLTPPSLYRHFADKADLLFEVCAAHFDRFDRDIVAPVLASEPDPIKALRRIAHDYVQYGLDQPEHYRIMFMGHADQRTLRTGCFGSVIRVVERAVEQGQIRDIEGGATMAAYVLWSAVHGIVAARVAKPNMPGPPTDQLVETVVDVFLEGMQVPLPC